MKTCRWLVISKWWLEKFYGKTVKKLDNLFGGNWYIYQYYDEYYLVVGECEKRIESLKFDLKSLVDWTEFWLLVSKHVK